MTPFEIAARSLRENISNLSSGKYLCAGQNQFQTLWTRDFCHAVSGLLVIGEGDVARHHLTSLLNSLRDDGLVPRVLDNLPVQLRVSWQTLRRRMPFLPRLPFREPLRPQYVDEHGSCAFDSNLLLILASLELGEDFIREQKEKLLKAWHWYDDKFDRGLLTQSGFSDWQDTTKREGRTFLLNLFYWMAGQRLATLGFIPARPLAELSAELKAVFAQDGLFCSLEGRPQVSLEGNLFAILDPDFLSREEKSVLWSALKAHPLMALDGGLGRCSYPDWPREDLAFHIRLANLHRYHGSLTWSWLLGLALLAGQEIGDTEFCEAQRRRIAEILQRDGEVYEVFDPDTGLRPWGSWLIGAEHPFAWGAAYLCRALKASEPVDLGAPLG